MGRFHFLATQSWIDSKHQTITHASEMTWEAANRLCHSSLPFPWPSDPPAPPRTADGRDRPRDETVTAQCREHFHHNENLSHLLFQTR